MNSQAKAAHGEGKSALTHLECSACGKKFSHQALQNLCTCGKPLLARYDLKQAARTLTREALANRVRTMWRYAEVLPGNPAVSLGEGMTPLIAARRLGQRLGLTNLFVKDEGLNPTGSFKARGLSAAVTQAKALGAKTLAIPTAGNAGGALAAYAAAAGLPAVIVMPADTPAANVMESRAFGADVRKLNGLISDCGKYVAENKDREGWFDVSTLKEPYRIEGKKTMGYELWEQFDGKLPDVVIYPTGGGVGLIGMCKGFDEMEAMGWIGKQRPRAGSSRRKPWRCSIQAAATSTPRRGRPRWTREAMLAQPGSPSKRLVDGRGLEPPAFPVVTGTLSTGRSEGIGGRQGTRTPGLLVANEALSQLS